MKRSEPHWRVDNKEHPIGLKLSRSGERTIGVEEGADDKEKARSGKAAAKAPRRLLSCPS